MVTRSTYNNNNIVLYLLIPNKLLHVKLFNNTGMRTKESCRYFSKILFENFLLYTFYYYVEYCYVL